MFHLLDKSLKGRRKQREKSESSSTSTSTTTTARLINMLNLPYFPQWERFDDDIRKLVLSFVAEAPFERKLGSEYQQPGHGVLTSTLPLVSKQFYQFAALDYFWEPVLARQLAHKHHGILWRVGLSRLLPVPHDVLRDANANANANANSNANANANANANSNSNSNSNTDANTNGDGSELDVESLRRTVRALKEQYEEYRGITCRDIYRKVLTSHIYFDAPVFIMPCFLQIGEIYGLHLFEPRYRVMVHELIAGCENPLEASSGGTIRIGRRNGVLTPPFLIHACLGRVAPGELACLVQLVWCHTYEAGTADVRLLPVAWVKLDRIWLRRDAYNLFYAKAWRQPPDSIR